MILAVATVLLTFLAVANRICVITQIYMSEIISFERFTVAN